MVGESRGVREAEAEVEGSARDRDDGEVNQCLELVKLYVLP
jgi:hypothetical protein